MPSFKDAVKCGFVYVCVCARVGGELLLHREM